MQSYVLTRLGIRIRFVLMNFKAGAVFEKTDLVRDGGEERPDLELILFRDDNGLLDRLSEGRASGLVGRAEKGLRFAETMNFGSGKVFCFFENGIKREFMLDRGMMKAVALFQDRLDVVMLHSGSVVKDGKLNIFLAPSGGGKTTICGMAEANGYETFDDEACIIRRKGEKYYASLFPFTVFPGRSREIEVSSVYFLDKRGDNRVRAVSPVESLKRAFPEATSLFYPLVPEGRRPVYMAHAFHFLENMMEKVEFKTLEFNKKAGALSCLA